MESAGLTMPNGPGSFHVCAGRLHVAEFLRIDVASTTSSTSAVSKMQGAQLKEIDTANI